MSSQGNAVHTDHTLVGFEDEESLPLMGDVMPHGPRSRALTGTLGGDRAGETVLLAHYGFRSIDIDVLSTSRQRTALQSVH